MGAIDSSDAAVRAAAEAVRRAAAEAARRAAERVAEKASAAVTAKEKSTEKAAAKPPVDAYKPATPAHALGVAAAVASAPAPQVDAAALGNAGGAAKTALAFYAQNKPSADARGAFTLGLAQALRVDPSAQQVFAKMSELIKAGDVSGAQTLESAFLDGLRGKVPPADLATIHSAFEQARLATNMAGLKAAGNAPELSVQADVDAKWSRRYQAIGDKSSMTDADIARLEGKPWQGLANSQTSQIAATIAKAKQSGATTVRTNVNPTNLPPPDVITAWDDWSAKNPDKGLADFYASQKGKLAIPTDADGRRRLDQQMAYLVMTKATLQDLKGNGLAADVVVDVNRMTMLLRNDEHTQGAKGFVPGKISGDALKALGAMTDQAAYVAKLASDSGASRIEIGNEVDNLGNVDGHANGADRDGAIDNQKDSLDRYAFVAGTLYREIKQRAPGSRMKVDMSSLSFNATLKKLDPLPATASKADVDNYNHLKGLVTSTQAQMKVLQDALIGLGVRWESDKEYAKLQNQEETFRDQCAQLYYKYDPTPPTAEGWMAANVREIYAFQRDNGLLTGGKSGSIATDETNIHLYAWEQADQDMIAKYGQLMKQGLLPSTVVVSEFGSRNTMKADQAADVENQAAALLDILGAHGMTVGELSAYSTGIQDMSTGDGSYGLGNTDGDNPFFSLDPSQG